MEQTDYNFLVPIVLFSWIPIVLGMFAMMPPRRAAMLAFLLAWMFLPWGIEFKLQGIPAYERCSATTAGVLLGTALFAPSYLQGIRLRLLDLPMIVWCLCPFASSISNGLGAYDGVSAVMRQTMQWGMPYLIGRLYLRKFEDLREAAVMMFIAGLIYVPLCIWEIRMSPNMNHHIYGYGEAGIAYAKELGKWGSRPRVFMGSALTVGMFMTAASLVGVWLYLTGSLRKLGSYSVGGMVLLLLATALGCKNLGAITLLVLALAVLFSIRWLHTTVMIYLLLLMPPLWVTLRANGTWSAASLVDAVSSLHAGRAQSLQTRLTNEDMLTEKALQQPWFGWGGWGRNRIYDEEGKDICLTDGMWIIALGAYGMVGLVALMSWLLLPPAVMAWRFRPGFWLHPTTAPAGALAVLMAVYSVDTLFNSITANPIYVVVAGGLVGCLHPSPAPSQNAIRDGRNERSARHSQSRMVSPAVARQVWSRQVERQVRARQG